MSRSNTWENLDWITILVYLFLIVAGWLNIYSAAYVENAGSVINIDSQYGKQMIWIVFSLILGFFVLVSDSKFFVSFSYVLYGITILLLIAVLFFGREVNASKSWFVIGGFAFQPAELAKLGTALAVARIISSHGFNFNKYKKLLSLLLVILLPVVLIFLQNDAGSAIVYAVFILPFFREGMSGLILFFGVFFALIFILSIVVEPIVLLILIIAAAMLTVLILRRKWSDILYALVLNGSLFLLFWLLVFLAKDSQPDSYFILLYSSLLSSGILLVYGFFLKLKQVIVICGIFLASVLFSLTVDYAFDNMLQSHQQSRINHLLGVEFDPLGSGYNVNQSKIAIGSGGLMGKGFLNGTQTKYDFVPEQSTDFIFCTVGEEWGFVGTSLVVLAFVFLLIRLIIIAERQRSVFSRVFGYSVASILFFHFSINIGMTIGLAPVVGIPLPFFSYGGSSLWGFTLLIFILLKLDTNRREQLH